MSELVIEPNANIDAALEPILTESPEVIVRKPKMRAKPKFAFPIPIKAVVFDLDGTLLDTIGDLTTAANLMRGSLGFDALDAALIKTFVGKGLDNLVARTLKDAVGEVGPTALKVAVNVFKKHYEKCCMDTTLPFPGVLDGLNALKDAGFRLGVVTNKGEKFSHIVLEQSGLRDYFEILIAGDTLTEKKPHALPVLHAAEFFGIPSSELLVIGDSVNDAQAARAAGSPIFLVPYGYNEGEEIRGLDCDAYIDDVFAALKLVRMTP